MINRAQQEYTIEMGKKTTRDLSLLMMKADSFTDMLGYLTETFGPPGQSIIYNMGADNGAKEARRLREELAKLEIPVERRELLERSLTRLSQMGWGKFTLRDLDPMGGEINIDVDHNPFSDRCGLNESGGCMFLQGYVAGILREMLEEEVTFRDPRCIDSSPKSCSLRLKRGNL